MLRDVLVVALDKGQFLLAVSSLIAMVVVLKFSAQELITLVARVLDSLERGCLFGYLAAAVLAVSCFARSRKNNQSQTSQRHDR
jgi:hypothetical protein